MLVCLVFMVPAVLVVFVNSCSASSLFRGCAFTFVLFAPPFVLFAVDAFSYFTFAALVLVLLIPATPVSWFGGLLLFTFLPSFLITLAFSLLNDSRCVLSFSAGVAHHFVVQVAHMVRFQGPLDDGRSIFSLSASLAHHFVVLVAHMVRFQGPLDDGRLMFFTEEASYYGVHASLVGLGGASALVFPVFPWSGVLVWVSLAMLLAVVASQLPFCTPPRVFLVLHTLTSVVVGAAGEIRLSPEA